MPKGNMGMPYRQRFMGYIMIYFPLFLCSSGFLMAPPRDAGTHVLPPIFVEPTQLKKKNLQGRVLILKEFGIGNLPAGNADRC